VGDLTKVFDDRYGSEKLYQLPDDDAGREDLRILLDHYAHANSLAMSRVVKTRAPWMADTERDNLLDEVNRFPRRWTAQALANKLNLTDADRQRLKIRTIGAVDVTPKERKRLSKRRKREQERERQRAKRHGLRTRAQYLVDVKSKEPWVAAGMKRRTWYRRRKLAANDTVALGVLEIKLPNRSNTPCATEPSLAASRPLDDEVSPNGTEVQRSPGREASSGTAEILPQ
jgi:hypothetical protein